jgi:hypothetical protein
MQITEAQTSPEALAAFAAEAAHLLVAGKFAELCSQFGYAVALGREPVAAIASDLAGCLAELGASELSAAVPTIRVSRFEPGSELVALAEGLLAAEPRGSVLLELVVTARGEQLHCTLEQVSAVA